MRKNLFIAVLFLLFTGCYKDDEYSPTEAEMNTKINTWIKKIMSSYYYWNEELQQANEEEYAQPPDAFFNALLSENDRFSWISDNANENSDLLHGVKKSLGFEYVLMYQDEYPQKLIGEVLFTYPNSSAVNNDIRRGDFFNIINNDTLTVDNYERLLNMDDAEYKFYRYGNALVESIAKDVKQEVLDINPILIYKVIDVQNAKIGYICYNQFIADNGDDSGVYANELLNCFKYFKNSKVDNLIIDVRYNGGGLIDLAVILSSLIIPDIDTTKIALEAEYNNNLMKLYGPQKMKFKSYTEAYIGDKLKIYCLLPEKVQLPQANVS